MNIKTQFVLILTLAGASVTAASGADAMDAARLRRARVTLKLMDATVQQLSFPDKPVVVHEIRFQHERATWTLRLEPFSVRSPDFEVLVQQADGSLKSEPPPPVCTWRGEIVEQAGSRAVASIIDGKLTALIQLPTDTWHIQPVPTTPEDTTLVHAIYNARQVIPDPRGRCGVENSQANGNGNIDLPVPAGGPTEGGVTRATSIAFDADFEYYQANGSSVTATVLDIEDILTGVDQIYRSESNISYILRTVIVRASVNDPYTTGLTAQAMRDEFRNFWIANGGGIVRDVAHLMSNRVSTNGFIGFAYFAGICNANNGDNSGYAYSEGRFTTNRALRVALVAHELGHNWNAQHCDGQSDCSLMCSNLGSCTGNITEFGISAQVSIAAFAAGINCFDTLQNPVFVNGAYVGFENGSLTFPYNTVREGAWGVNHFGGTVAVTGGTYPETLLLNRSMTIQSSGGTVTIAP